MDLFDFQEDWEKLVGKVFQHGYRSLTPEETVWFNVQSLTQAVNDGGLISFFYNSGADHLEDTLKLSIHLARPQ